MHILLEKRRVSFVRLPHYIWSGYMVGDVDAIGERVYATERSVTGAFQEWGLVWSEK